MMSCWSFELDWSESIIYTCYTQNNAFVCDDYNSV